MSYRNQGRGRQSHRGQSQGRGYSHGRGQSRDQSQEHNPAQSRNQYQNRGRSQSSQGGYPYRGSSSGSAGNPPEPSSTVTTNENTIISNPKDGSQNITPRRPAYGNEGKDIVLWANHFELKADKRSNLYFYLISFPDKTKEPKGRKLARVVKLLLDKIKPLSAVTDFANTLISHEELTENSFEVPYSDEYNTQSGNNTVTYKVKIENTRTLSIDYLLQYLQDPKQPHAKEVLSQIVQAFNIFLNHYPQESKDYATIGSDRSFPLNQLSPPSLPYGCFALKGYYSSIRLATSRILVNINVSYGVFHGKERLDGIISKFIDKWGDSPVTLQKLAASLKGIRIEYDYLKDKEGKSIRRVKTIFDLASPGDGKVDKNDKTKKQPEVPKYGAKTDEVKFWFNDSYISVFKFFETKHKITVHKTVPLINVGSRERPTYLPSDVCYVLYGQRAKIVRYDNDMVSNIPIHSPSDNANDIENNGLRAIGLSKGDARNEKRLENFGISVSNPELITVRGRRMSEPEIRYNRGHVIKKSNWNLANIQLAAKTAEKRGLCVTIGLGKGDVARLKNTLQQLRDMLKENGVFITTLDSSIVEITNNKTELESKLRDVFERKIKNVDFLLVVLSKKEAFTYNCVKRLGDIEYGVPTLCIFKNNLVPKPPPGNSSSRRDGSSHGNSSRNAPEDTPRISENLVGNLALKLNLKFNNNNQIVNLAKLRGKLNLRETMIVGIDVTHSPTPGQPSIAGMVASIDENLGQWPAVLRHQDKPRVEMVTRLEEMLETRLKLWCSRHKSYPKNIIVYRDGVSEGQYELVIKEELPKLKEACKKLYTPAHMPKITIVVVGKRHHTRFYAGMHKGNPTPGTVVDRGVTEAVNWDFFLQSHRPIRGTARPAHYFVVHDEIFKGTFTGENENVASMLEVFTHSLCFIFGRSTNPVSICTPAYYADIACSRARCYVAADVAAGATDAAAQVPSSASDEKQPPPGSNGLLLHPKMKDSMFYI